MLVLRACLLIYAYIHIRHWRNPPSQNPAYGPAHNFDNHVNSWRGLVSRLYAVSIFTATEILIQFWSCMYCKLPVSQQTPEYVFLFAFSYFAYLRQNSDVLPTGAYELKEYQ